MSVVSPANLDSNLTDNEVWQAVNTMPVTYLDFAFNAHYWGKMFGVITGEQNEQDWDGFSVNQCLRDSLWRTLYTIVTETERYLGYFLSRRYMSVEKEVETLNRLYVYPGIEKVDVVPTWTDIVGYDAVAVSPFIVENATVVPGSPNTVLVPTDVCGNPLEIIIRRDSDDGSYGLYKNQAYKPYRDGLGNWVVALNDVVPYTLGDVVNVQDTRYVYVDIDPPVCTGTIYPVYPGTNQIIPQAKTVQTLQNGKLRYWFYIYTLVDPVFYNYVTNLVDAEFYKLLPSISFKCYSEVEVTPTLTITHRDTCSCSGTCDDAVYALRTNIEDAKLGIVSFSVIGKYENNVVNTTKCVIPSCSCSCMYKLNFSYITNPVNLSSMYSLSIPVIKRSIINRSAAELPLDDCGCAKDDRERVGFIWKQQQMISSSTVRAFSGDITTHFKYGDLRGQLEYTDIISKMPRHKFILWSGTNAK